MVLDKQDLYNALEAAGIYDHEEAIIPAYLGRWSTDEGFGVKVDRVSTLFSAFLALGFDAFEKCEDEVSGGYYDDLQVLAQSARVDAFGKQALVYFPGWTLV